VTFLCLLSFMWTEKELYSDLDSIKNGEYLELGVFSKEHPKDITLLYRFNMVTLMSLFKQNKFSDLHQHANAYYPSIVDYLKKWNEEYLDPGQPAPPFDFMMLISMTSNQGFPAYEKFLQLFKFYRNLLQCLSNMIPERQIRLTDCARPNEMMMTVSKAKDIVAARCDYIAENIVSYLYSNNHNDILITFLDDFYPCQLVNSDSTLSHLGRAALACGDIKRAQSYFMCVKDSNQQTANNGYISFYDCQFRSAHSSFSKARRPAIPTDIDICRLHMGESVGDLSETTSTPKKPTLESRTQWPSMPKVK